MQVISKNFFHGQNNITPHSDDGSLPRTPIRGRARSTPPSPGLSEVHTDERGQKWQKWQKWQKRGRNDRNDPQSWTAPRSALERGQLWQKWQKWQVKSRNYLRSSAPKATSPRTRMTGPAQSSMDNRTLTNDISLQKPRIRTPFPQHMKPCS